MEQNDYRGEKVSDEQMKKNRNSEPVKVGGVEDVLDAADKGAGRIFSKIGKFLCENW